MAKFRNNLAELEAFLSERAALRSLEYEKDVRDLKEHWSRIDKDFQEEELEWNRQHATPMSVLMEPVVRVAPNLQVDKYTQLYTTLVTSQGVTEFTSGQLLSLHKETLSQTDSSCDWEEVEPLFSGIAAVQVSEQQQKVQFLQRAKDQRDADRLEELARIQADALIKDNTARQLDREEWEARHPSFIHGLNETYASSDSLQTDLPPLQQLPKSVQAAEDSRLLDEILEEEAKRIVPPPQPMSPHRHELGGTLQSVIHADEDDQPPAGYSTMDPFADQRKLTSRDGDHLTEILNKQTTQQERAVELKYRRMLQLPTDRLLTPTERAWLANVIAKDRAAEDIAERAYRADNKKREEATRKSIEIRTRQLQNPTLDMGAQDSATKIQAAWRGKQARSYVGALRHQQMMQETMEEVDTTLALRAAIIIQSWFRGVVGRRRARETKWERYKQQYLHSQQQHPTEQKRPATFNKTSSPPAEPYQRTGISGLDRDLLLERDNEFYRAVAAAVPFLQSRWRGFALRLKLSVLRRQILRERAEAQYKEMNAAATRIQALWRSYSARLVVDEMHGAAIMIQAWIRGVLTRIEFQPLQYGVEGEKAALRIQALWRGHTGRQLGSKQRDLKERQEAARKREEQERREEEQRARREAAQQEINLDRLRKRIEGLQKEEAATRPLVVKEQKLQVEGLRKYSKLLKDKVDAQEAARAKSRHSARQGMLAAAAKEKQNEFLNAVATNVGLVQQCRAEAKKLDAELKRKAEKAEEEARRAHAEAQRSAAEEKRKAAEEAARKKRLQEEDETRKAEEKRIQDAKEREQARKRTLEAERERIQKELEEAAAAKARQLQSTAEENQNKLNAMGSTLDGQTEQGKHLVTSAFGEAQQERELLAGEIARARKLREMEAKNLQDELAKQDNEKNRQKATKQQQKQNELLAEKQKLAAEREKMAAAMADEQFKLKVSSLQQTEGAARTLIKDAEEEQYQHILALEEFERATLTQALEQAARSIQKSYRGHQGRRAAAAKRAGKAREDGAARTIQSGWKNHNARKESPEMIAQKRKLKQHKAAKKIQALERGRQARKQVQTMKHEKDKYHLAAAQIQAMQRGVSARQMIGRQMQASITIQAAQRGYATRKRVNGLKMERQMDTYAKHYNKIVLIQKMWRAFVTREWFKANRVYLEIARARRTVRKTLTLLGTNGQPGAPGLFGGVGGPTTGFGGQHHGRHAPVPTSSAPNSSYSRGKKKKGINKRPTGLSKKLAKSAWQAPTAQQQQQGAAGGMYAAEQHASGGPVMLPPMSAQQQQQMQGGRGANPYTQAPYTQPPYAPAPYTQAYYDDSLPQRHGPAYDHTQLPQRPASTDPIVVSVPIETHNGYPLSSTNPYHGVNMSNSPPYTSSPPNAQHAAARRKPENKRKAPKRGKMGSGGGVGTSMDGMSVGGGGNLSEIEEMSSHGGGRPQSRHRLINEIQNRKNRIDLLTNKLLGKISATDASAAEAGTGYQEKSVLLPSVKPGQQQYVTAGWG